jgi:signal transduction histidine kinase
MQERAELLGGHLSVTSSPGYGTKVLFCAEIKE